MFIAATLTLPMVCVYRLLLQPFGANHLYTIAYVENAAAIQAFMPIGEVMKPYSCSLVILYMTLCGPPLSAQTESGAEFKSKALAEWNGLSERIKSVRGKMHHEFHSTGFHPTLDGVRLHLQKTEDDRYAYSRVGFYFERELGDIDESGNIKEFSHSLFLRNDEYSAELKRRGENGGWLLANLKMGGVKYRTRNRTFPWLVLFDGSVWVPEWFQDPSFVITGIEKLHGGTSGQLSRVHFRYDGSRLQAPESSNFIFTDCTVSGYVDFDDRLSYRIMDYVVHYKYAISEGDRKGELVYEGGDGIPMLKAITEETPKQHNYKSGWGSSKSIQTYEYSYDADPSPEEFRLSHYDLPEPLGVAPLPKSHTYLWIALGAVGAAVIAIFFSWKAQRARKTQTSA